MFNLKSKRVIGELKQDHIDVSRAYDEASRRGAISLGWIGNQVLTTTCRTTLFLGSQRERELALRGLGRSVKNRSLIVAVPGGFDTRALRAQRGELGPVVHIDLTLGRASTDGFNLLAADGFPEERWRRNQHVIEPFVQVLMHAYADLPKDDFWRAKTTGILESLMGLYCAKIEMGRRGGQDLQFIRDIDPAFSGEDSSLPAIADWIYQRSNALGASAFLKGCRQEVADIRLAIASEERSQWLYKATIHLSAILSGGFVASDPCGIVIEHILRVLKPFGPERVSDRLYVPTIKSTFKVSELFDERLPPKTIIIEVGEDKLSRALAAGMVDAIRLEMNMLQYDRGGADTIAMVLDPSIMAEGGQRIDYSYLIGRERLLLSFLSSHAELANVAGDEHKRKFFDLMENTIEMRVLMNAEERTDAGLALVFEEPRPWWAFLMRRQPSATAGVKMVVCPTGSRFRPIEIDRITERAPDIS